MAATSAKREACVLEPALDAPAAARRFVRFALSSWGVDDVFVDAPLLASELVTNAVRHVGSRVELVVALAPDRLRLEIHDGSAQQPVMTDLATTRGGGWGLHIVAHLATRWGIDADAAGKTIWCEVVMPGP